MAPGVDLFSINSQSRCKFPWVCRMGKGGASVKPMRNLRETAQVFEFPHLGSSFLLWGVTFRRTTRHSASTCATDTKLRSHLHTSEDSSYLHRKKNRPNKIKHWEAAISGRSDISQSSCEYIQCVEGLSRPLGCTTGACRRNLARVVPGLGWSK